jgi:hypothetical protein
MGTTTFSWHFLIFKLSSFFSVIVPELLSLQLSDLCLPCFVFFSPSSKQTNKQTNKNRVLFICLSYIKLCIGKKLTTPTNNAILGESFLV